MSYADMAAKGPKQSNDEKVPDTVPEIAHSDSGVHSLETLDSSPHIVSTPSYADQQLQAEEDAAEEAASALEPDTQEARDLATRAEQELKRLEKEAGKKYNEFSAEAKQQYQAWRASAGREYAAAKKEATKAGKQGKKEAQKAERWADANKGNPVVVGNAVVIAALGGLLGTGAYRMQQAGTLTWKIAGAWAGVVGLFAVSDYYVSQYLFKKYPPKQQ